MNSSRPIYGLESMFANQIHTAEAESSKVYEPLIGVVTDNKDPSKLGRVKVKLPILSDEDSTFWAPIVMSGAGKNRGWFFIPEPEDEVLVIFEHGDLNRPLIVGSLWNGKDTPPSDNKTGKNDQRMIKSRQGNKVCMDDGDNPNIVLEDGAGKGRITLDTKNNKIIIEALEGDVCFQCPTGDMTIVAKSMELKAKENVEVHAGSTMAWGCDTTVKINGSSGVTTSGSTSNPNCGNAQAPQAPTADPKDVSDPYGDGGGSSGAGAGAGAGGAGGAAGAGGAGGAGAGGAGAGGAGAGASGAKSSGAASGGGAAPRVSFVENWHGDPHAPGPPLPPGVKPQAWRLGKVGPGVSWDQLEAMMNAHQVGPDTRGSCCFDMDQKAEAISSYWEQCKTSGKSPAELGYTLIYWVPPDSVPGGIESMHYPDTSA